MATKILSSFSNFRKPKDKALGSPTLQGSIASDEVTNGPGDGKALTEFLSDFKEVLDSKRLYWLRRVLDGLKPTLMNLDGTAHVLTVQTMYAELLADWIPEEGIERPRKITILSSEPERETVKPNLQDLADVVINTDVEHLEANSHALAICDITTTDTPDVTLRVMKNIHHLLQPGGTAIFITPSRNTLVEAIKDMMAMGGNGNAILPEYHAYQAGGRRNLAVQASFHDSTIQLFPRKYMYRGEILRRFIAVLKDGLNAAQRNAVDLAIGRKIAEDGELVVEFEILVATKEGELEFEHDVTEPRDEVESSAEGEVRVEQEVAATDVDGKKSPRESQAFSEPREQRPHSFVQQP